MISLADKEFVEPYGARYNIKVLSEPSILLGIEITRDRAARTLTLKQGLYIEKIFNKFCSARTTKDFSVPVHQAGIDTFHAMQLGDEDDRLALGHRNLLELLGSLLWATATHPEIDFYVSWLCQFMSAPKVEHYDAGLAVLSYLYHSKEIGITYSASRPDLEAFCDASWGVSRATSLASPSSSAARRSRLAPSASRSSRSPRKRPSSMAMRRRPALYASHRC